MRKFVVENHGWNCTLEDSMTRECEIAQAWYAHDYVNRQPSANLVFQRLKSEETHVGKMKADWLATVNDWKTGMHPWDASNLLETHKLVSAAYAAATEGDK